VTIVVGIDPVGPNQDVVTLAADLQPLMDADVILATVRPPTIEIPSRGNVDAEWTAFLHERAETALGAAAKFMTDTCGVKPSATRIVVQGSVSRGLRALAAEVGGVSIVIGPGSSGVAGHLALGSVAQSLLHSGETSVALTPAGYASASTTITRLVVGFTGDTASEGVVTTALDLAQVSRTPVDLLTVVIRATRIPAPRLGSDPESAVLQAVTEQAMQAQAQMRQEHPVISGIAVEQADTVQDAMDQFDWRAGDVLVLGSGADGILHRVFLGDTSHQLLRAARVPTLVLPRA
jgi:nucleotide-binding universal stress UspA family protein